MCIRDRRISVPPGTDPQRVIDVLREQGADAKLTTASTSTHPDEAAL